MNLFASIFFRSFAALVLTALVSFPAAAQPATGDSHRAALVEALPTWWAITDFSLDGAEATVAEASTAKPGATPASRSGRGFTATIELSQDLYEPIYSTGGAAFVQPTMDAGVELRISGTIQLATDVSEAVVEINQSGLERIGTPLDGFETTAYVIGSDEANAFLDAQNAARAEGDRRKLMSDEGTDL